MATTTPLAMSISLTRLRRRVTNSYEKSLVGRLGSQGRNGATLTRAIVGRVAPSCVCFFLVADSDFFHDRYFKSAIKGIGT